MRTAKIVLGLTSFAALILVSCGWILSREAPVAPGEIGLGPQTEYALSFLQENMGLSRRDAVSEMHRAALLNDGQRIVDRFDIPPGATLDFIEVDGTKAGKESVRFLGTGRAVPASSPEGLAFWRVFERAARAKGWTGALRAMRNLRDSGLVVAPAWFGAGGQVATTAATTAGRGATAATNIRVAVICARFPAWRDRAPLGDGNGSRGSPDLYYEFDPQGRQRHVDPSVDPGNPLTWPGTVDWYIDSPGGRMPAAGGEPLGTQAQWDDEHPARVPNAADGPTTPKLQDYWYRHVFDLNFTGGMAPPGMGGWASSLHNYYWSNSNGNINITGAPTDVYGWIETHHVLDRLPYPSGPDPIYMVQPGTPLIRPSSQIEASDGVTREILRASLTGSKLTILYEDEFLGSSPPWPTLWVRQRDVDNVADDQNGWVRIALSGANTTQIGDPYDRRRWTYAEVDWEFTKIGATSTTDFAIWAGEHWAVETTHGAGYVWRSRKIDPSPAEDPVVGASPPDGAVSPRSAAQDRGCGALPNTLFTQADVALQCGVTPVGAQNPPYTTGNRFKSFDYYCHDHFVNRTRGPYQIEHINHGSSVDDIGGDSEPGGDNRKPRPYPFDCGLPSALGGGDRMQLGYFSFPNNDNAGAHSAGGMRADVNAAMTDAGIQLGSAYNRTVYIFAGDSPSEGGGTYSAPSSWGSIIAHAGGSMVTIGETTGLLTFAHEMGHTFGFGDLYDMDFYTNKLNGQPPNPLYFECPAMGPYSVMAFGGVRVDAYHKIGVGWLSGDKLVALESDRPNSEIPAVEGVLREPIVYKLPANPYYIVDGVPPAAWQEHYLVEYRDVPDAQPAGYFGDQSPKGIYVYHIDNRGVGQIVEGLMKCSIVQADGLNELEVNSTSQGPGSIAGDPFGGPPDLPDANPNFCQWNFRLDDWLGGSSSPRPAPRAYSHGLFNNHGIDGRPQKIGDTEADSFTRVLNIRVSRAMAYADIYVRPAEVVATGGSAWRDIINSDAVPDQLAWQGLQNVSLLKLTLDNRAYTPGDYRYMSMDDVTIQDVRILESGSSPNDPDVARAKIWVDNGDGNFDPASDSLLNWTTVTNQQALFSQLNYEVPLGEARDLFVTYDVGETAQINPKITLGADLPEPRYLMPQAPGTVQERVRNAAQFSFGAARFPIQTAVGEVLEGTDTVFISSSSLAPGYVQPMQQRVPVMRMLMSVDHDRAIVRRLRFRCNPDAGVGHTPTMPQDDVDLAELWLDTNQNGALEPAQDTKLAEAVFSNATDLLFDGLDLTVNAGGPIHLLVSFNIAADVDLAGGAHWLELEIPTWFDNGGTPGVPTDDVYYVRLVDEDGPNNTLYGNPADANDIRDAAHLAAPADAETWKTVAGADVVDAGGAPWKSNDFAVRPPNPPTLSNVTIVPASRHGSKSDVFTLGVTYTSLAGLMPAYVRLVYRHQAWPAATANMVVAMNGVDPTDTNVADGKRYEVQLSATDFVDWGQYRHYFTASDKFTPVYHYDPDGPTAGDPEGSYDETYRAGGPLQKAADANLIEWLVGPILGTPSVLRFTDSAYIEVNQFEEGARLYMELLEPDENANIAVPDTLNVLVESTVTGDQEPVVLTETGNNTGLFHGSILTLGRYHQAPPDNDASGDGVLNVIAGATGQVVQVTYEDKDDWPAAGANDTSVDTATVVDTTAPAQVLPGALALTSGDQGRTIDVEWTAYDEDAQVDVAPDGGYRVYISENTDFTTVAGLTPVADLPPSTWVTGGGVPGTQMYQITSLPNGDPIVPGRTYYVAVTAYDEVPNERTAVTTTAITPADVLGPELVLRVPDDGDTNVPLDQVISVRLQDAGAGMDWSTFTFEVQVTNRGTIRQPRVAVGNWVQPQPPSARDANDQVVTFDPGTVDPAVYPALAAGWTWNDVVDVWLHLADNAGNPLDSHWVFSLPEDRTRPYVDVASQSPANGEADVPFSEPVEFDMADDVSGVDPSTLEVELRIVDVRTGRQRVPWTDITADPGFSVTWTPDYLRGAVLYEPAEEWHWNDQVEVRARAADRAGNVRTAWEKWVFYTLSDLNHLAIINEQPTDTSIDVVRDTNISFHAIDGEEDEESGVDPTTITLTVNGVAIPYASLHIQGNQYDYEVTYNRPTDFEYGQAVQCVATAKDAAGNQVTRTWSFTVVDDTERPQITPMSPKENDSGVGVNTNIVVSITDNETGLVAGSVNVVPYVGGAAVAGSLTKDVQPDGKTINATFDPTASLPYNTTVTVKVWARDNRGNEWDPPFEYTFSTRTARTFMIVGRVTDGAGNAIAAVNVALGGVAQANSQTDGNGYFRFSRLVAGNYTVQPSLTGWSFTPAQRQIDVQQNVDNADFTGVQQTFNMAGTVTSSDGTALPGVTIQVDGQTATTGAQGRWSFQNLTIGEYTVTPSLANYRFDPASRTVQITAATNPNDLLNLDFRAVPFTFSVAGVVTDYEGNRMDAVLVTADGRTAVTSETGRYQLGGIPTGTVQVGAEKQGWSFVWQDAQGVWHAGAQPVTVPPDQTAANFVGYRTFRHAFSTGVHLIGVPATPYDPAAATVFGTDAVARWDPAAAVPGYVTPRLRPGADILNVAPGRGFFVRFTEGADLEVLGIATDPNAAVNTGLVTGWNMQANPFDAQLPFASVQTLSGTVRPFGYVYDPVRRSYLLVAQTPGVGIDRSYMLPWEGIWLRALSTASIRVSPPTQAAAAESVESLQLDLGSGGWWIPVVARAGDRSDECCAVGVMSSGAALALEKPPAMPDAVDVSVEAADGTRLSRSIAVGTQGKHEWDLVVATDVPDADVSVSLPDLSRVPHEMTVTVTDLGTGKTMYARTMSCYRFQVGPSGGSRKLRLTVEPRTEAGLVVSSASARTQGARVVVTYSVSSSCRVQARVLNIAGRPVRVLASDSAATAGVNTLAWDGRNASGSMTPSGLYLVEIEALAENGQRAKTVTQVRYAPVR